MLDHKSELITSAIVKQTVPRYVLVRKQINSVDCGAILQTPTALTINLAGSTYLFCISYIRSSAVLMILIIISLVS